MPRTSDPPQQGIHHEPHRPHLHRRRPHHRRRRLVRPVQPQQPPSWANEEMKPFTSTVSREQVQAELAAARANGTVDQFDSLAYLKQDHLGNPVAVAVAKVSEGASKVAATQTSGISREQVRAEVEAARANGELNPFDNLAYMNTSAPARVRTAPA